MRAEKIGSITHVFRIKRVWLWFWFGVQEVQVHILALPLGGVQRSGWSVVYVVPVD